MTTSYNPAFKGFYDEHIILFRYQMQRYTRSYIPGKGIITTHWLMTNGREYSA